MPCVLFPEQRRLREDEYPLEVRVVLGPHENIARLFLVDKLSTPEISSDVAQFLNLSLAECHGILQRYHYEEERQILLLKEKWVHKRRYTSENCNMNLLFQIQRNAKKNKAKNGGAKGPIIGRMTSGCTRMGIDAIIFINA